MGELEKKQQEEGAEASEKTEAVASLVREWYADRSPSEASEIISRSQPEDGHAAVRSLLAHYQGPLEPADFERLMGIIYEEYQSFEAWGEPGRHRGSGCR